MRNDDKNPLSLKCLNHISILKSPLIFIRTYWDLSQLSDQDHLIFMLFNYGIGIHLIQSEDTNGLGPVKVINPKDHHISFQCESMATVEERLKEMKIECIKSRVTEGGTSVDQLFFHDPDGLMIEICNCENLPVVPLRADLPIRSCPRVNYVFKQS
ncbi:hypothetical protein Cgig2_026178 [Carnegiea gigantea]|uniref:Glyoxalase/fosfomycin resistance/dioxygenase domain-containing protein n=1 Tax=Carnegiea gigantea TaxID=171969 RepID=A0A9Q1K5H0_9CARY|nr:hypothetical protein Cgig2_026178 [Carnegiea gigantea]